MSVVTRKRHDRYAIIPNAVAEDDRLTFLARGVLCYLLAKPNDWQVSVHDLRKSGKLGRDRAYKVLNELIKTGYITRIVQRDGAGKIIGQEYIVFDEAVPDQLPLPDVEADDAQMPFPDSQEVDADSNPFPENQEVAEPFPDLPDPVQPDPVNQDGIISTHLNKIPNLPIKEQFDVLWRAWAIDNLPASRKTAEQIFITLPSNLDRINAVKGCRSFQRMMFLRKRKPALIQYLEQRSWRDHIDGPDMDSEGRFIITRDFPAEWDAWKESARAEYGDHAVKTIDNSERMLRDTRWPPITEGESKDVA